jgi:hypothetical protein
MKFKYATMAAAMLAATGANAADLGRPAPAAVDYVKVCDAYGTGFFYIPGTETCLKIDGYVRADYRYGDTTPFYRVDTYARANARVNWNRTSTTYSYFGLLGGVRARNDIYTRARALLHFDARTNTEFGLLRSYIEAYWTVNSGSGGSTVMTDLDQAFIQFGGLTAGRAQSFYDFNTGYAMGMNYHSIWADSKTNLLAYTFSFGNGISASLSIEDPSTSARRRGGANALYRDTNVLGLRPDYAFGYQGMKLPDVVGQLRIAQAWGTAQLSAAAHHLYGNGPFRNTDDWGYAVGAGVEVNLPMIAPGDKVFLQAFYSDGAVQYACANCFSGAATAVGIGTIGGDAVYRGRGLKTTEAWSISGGFKHNFSAQWEFNIDGGYASVDGFGARDYGQTEVAADLRWKPVAGLTIGAALEYKNLDFTSATTRNFTGFSAPGVFRRLSDSDQWMAGLRVQRSF